MTHVDIPEGEPEPPLGQVVGERAIPADARQVARQILDQAEALLRRTTHAH